MWHFLAIEIVLGSFEMSASDMRKMETNNIIEFVEDASRARWEEKMKKSVTSELDGKRERRINYIGFAYLPHVLNFCVCFFSLSSKSLNCECDVNVKECVYMCARRDTPSEKMKNRWNREEKKKQILLWIHAALVKAM